MLPLDCSTGQGHPVHGWSWCVAKGWASAPYYGYPTAVRGWDVNWWDDARFRHRRIQGAGLDGFVLQIVAGSNPIAVLHDVFRDGRVDRVYLRPR